MGIPRKVIMWPLQSVQSASVLANSWSVSHHILNINAQKIETPSPVCSKDLQLRSRTTLWTMDIIILTLLMLEVVTRWNRVASFQGVELVGLWRSWSRSQVQGKSLNLLVILIGDFTYGHFHFGQQFYLLSCMQFSI